MCYHVFVYLACSGKLPAQRKLHGAEFWLFPAVLRRWPSLDQTPHPVHVIGRQEDHEKLGTMRNR